MCQAFLSRSRTTSVLALARQNCHATYNWAGRIGSKSSANYCLFSWNMYHCLVLSVCLSTPELLRTSAAHKRSGAGQTNSGHLATSVNLLLYSAKTKSLSGCTLTNHPHHGRRIPEGFCGRSLSNLGLASNRIRLPERRLGPASTARWLIPRR